MPHRKPVADLHPKEREFVLAEVTIDQKAMLVGLPIEVVHEVVGLAGYQRLPKDCLPFFGLISVRGRPIPVLSFDPENLPTDAPNARILVVHADNAEIGLAVLRTRGVQTLPIDDPSRFISSEVDLGLRVPVMATRMMQIGEDFILILEPKSSALDLNADPNHKEVRQVVNSGLNPS